MRDFQLPGRSPVFGTTCMVATSHPLAAAEAFGVLRDGGNAVDAAIAAAVILGVCEPHMTGLGGDCFALVHTPDGKVTALNGSGRAPSGIDADQLRADGLERIYPGHPASITVPGAVDGFCRLSERFGKLGLERSFAPAIAAFEEGVPVAPRVAEAISGLGESLSPDAQRHFLNNGKAYSLGQKLSAPGQAEILRRILREGSDGFYTGEVAEDMLTALRAVGGVHTPDDFAAVKATWGEPLSGPYRGKDLLEHPPNGQGATAILLAGILEAFDIASMDPFSAERHHILAEATKLAYDARNRFLADPDYMTALDRMLSPKLAGQMAGLIDPVRAMPAPAPLTEDIHKDTVLVTVVDRDGMAVSLIYSIFADFGAGVASPEFGILFHNRGSGFNLTPGHPNEVGPGKRPMHTIIPAMRSTNGKVDMAFGVMGGQYQATGHLHVLSNLADHGMDLQEALDAPRSFADPISGQLWVENGLSDSTVAALAEKGHEINRREGPIGGAQAIAIDHTRGLLIGASDPRKDGLAIGQ